MKYLVVLLLALSGSCKLIEATSTIEDVNQLIALNMQFGVLYPTVSLEALIKLNQYQTNETNRIYDIQNTTRYRLIELYDQEYDVFMALWNNASSIPGGITQCTTVSIIDINNIYYDTLNKINALQSPVTNLTQIVLNTYNTITSNYTRISAEVMVVAAPGYTGDVAAYNVQFSAYISTYEATVMAEVDVAGGQMHDVGTFVSVEADLYITDAANGISAIIQVLANCL